MDKIAADSSVSNRFDANFDRLNNLIDTFISRHRLIDYATRLRDETVDHYRQFNNDLNNKKLSIRKYRNKVLAMSRVIRLTCGLLSLAESKHSQAKEALMAETRSGKQPRPVTLMLLLAASENQ